MREYATNLENDLLRDKSWDATEVQSTHRQILKEEEYHPGPEPLSQANTQIVDIKAKEAPTNGFIYDITNITIDDLS